MGEIAIRVEGMGKRFRIERNRPQYATLRDAVTDGLRSRLRRLRPASRCESRLADGGEESIWALREVSFDVHRGDVVGIVGANGAGKSTLLKILSRITEPTEGRARIYGRLGSLLEVGTGFHPELSGRENIFLNAAILGMKRAEIVRKLDEIIAFAEIERFLDTPVKHYSSGMYVRLAFAVAAHLEPDILVIDEVLAVGDAAFQRKCLGRMQQVAGEGRTVLYVSHNLRSIRTLCKRALWLKAGRVEANGTSGEVVDRYLLDVPRAASAAELTAQIRKLPADPVFRLEQVWLKQDGEPLAERVQAGKPLEVGIRYRILERSTGLRVYFDLCDAEDTLLFRTFHDEDRDVISTTDPGLYDSIAVLPADLLAPAAYELRFQAGIYNVRHCLPDSVRLRIEVDATGRYNRSYPGDVARGALALAVPWTTRGVGT